MPHQLAAEMRRRGVLGVRGVRVTESVGSASSAGAVGFDPATQPEPLQQRAHVLGRSLQLARSTDVQVVAGPAGGPRTADEFRVSPVAAGSCVITRPATKTKLALLAPALQGLPFWVWRILRVVDPGSALPANSRRLAAADVTVFEAHLYSPDNGTATGVMRPVWDVQEETVFLRTPAEKQGRKEKKDKNNAAVLPPPVTLAAP